MVEQSQKKPKIAAQMIKHGEYWWKFHVDLDKNNLMFLSNYFLEAMKGWNRKRLPIFFSNDDSPRFCFVVKQKVVFRIVVIFILCWLFVSLLLPCKSVNVMVCLTTQMF